MKASLDFWHYCLLAGVVVSLAFTRKTRCKNCSAGSTKHS